MDIDSVILKLQALRKEHGNLKVCVASGDDYWGTIYNEVDNHLLRVDEHAQPEGPKSGKSEKAVVFNSDYSI
jgi:hypothetical protein